MLVMAEVLGMEIIVAGLRQMGTVACCSERLKICVNTTVSCSAYAFSTCPGMPSGPVALLQLMLDRALFT